jgi:hypothetical protein
MGYAELDLESFDLPEGPFAKWKKRKRKRKKVAPR